MKATEILNALCEQGFIVTLAGNGGLKVSPASRLDNSQRERLLAHKAEIVELLKNARHSSAQLLAAAMRACDHHHDSQVLRDQMRADCLATPPHLQADLLDHFEKTYQQDPK